MVDFEDMLQVYVDADYDVLAELVGEAAEELIPLCERIDDENGGFDLLVMIVLVAVYADGVVSPIEKRLMVDGLGMESDVAEGLVDMYDPSMVDVVFNIAACADEDEAASLASLIASFAAADEEITNDEADLLYALMEQT